MQHQVTSPQCAHARHEPSCRQWRPARASGAGGGRCRRHHADDDGWTPLHAASKGGHLACVRYLLSVPGVTAAINAVDALGWSAVWYAAGWGHVEVMKALVEAGANAAIADDDGWTALHAASLGGHLACVQYLLSVPGVVAAIDAADEDGWTAVRFAARGGHVEVVKALVEAGANAAAADRVGLTPLHSASSSGHLPCVVYLLSVPGVDPAAVCARGRTASMVAQTREVALAICEEVSPCLVPGRQRLRVLACPTPLCLMLILKPHSARSCPGFRP